MVHTPQHVHAMDGFDDMERGGADWDRADGSCEDGGEIPPEVSTKTVSGTDTILAAHVRREIQAHAALNKAWHINFNPKRRAPARSFPSKA